MAKTQTFFSHIHRNLRLTTVLGHNSKKTLSSCTIGLGDLVEESSHKTASLTLGWTCATGNRSATLSLHFKKRFSSGIWRQYTGQSPQAKLTLEVGVVGSTHPWPSLSVRKWGRAPGGRGAGPVFFVWWETSVDFCLNYGTTDVKLKASYLPVQKSLYPSNHLTEQHHQTVSTAATPQTFPCGLACTQKNTKLLFVVI